MASGRNCPVCGKDIGVWSIFAAGLPSRIRCPHCRTLLRYDGALFLIAIPFLLAMLAALVVHEAAIDLGLDRPGLFVVVLLLVTWIPIELLLALYLRENRTLRRVERKTLSR
jgi:hypothetical protein